jgi:hypothetical protein
MERGERRACRRPRLTARVWRVAAWVLAFCASAGGSLAQGIYVSTSDISNNVTQWNHAASQTFQIGCTDTSNVFWWALVDQPWLSVSPSSGTITSGLSTITVRYITANLDSGTNTAHIMIVAPSTTNSPLSVAVTMIIDSDGGSNRAVRAAPSCSGMPGYKVSVPIQLASLGNENALGFSLSYNKSIFTLVSVTNGVDASSASLLTNGSQSANGCFGIAVALPTGNCFSNGIQEIAVASFLVNSAAMPGSYSFGFTNKPIYRQVSDTNASAVSALWATGNVAVTAGYEAKVTPRPNSTNSSTVTVADWVQAGRFAAVMDTPSTMGEFQRADCAPRNTKGDGVLTITDWVQAGRYVALLDPVVEAGGPVSNLAGKVLTLGFAGKPALAASDKWMAAGIAQSRTVSVVNATMTRGETNHITVQLAASGNENALSFSLEFDPTWLSYRGANLGAGAQGGMLVVNTSQAMAGKVGLALALQPGTTFASGKQAVVDLEFYASVGYQDATTQVLIVGNPISREVASVYAAVLPSTFENGTVSLRRSPDMENPVVAIFDGAPGKPYYTYQSALTIHGAATDNVNVSHVAWINSAGGNGSCVGTTNWTAQNIPLTLGTNLLGFVATDSSSNASRANLVVVYPMTEAEALFDDDSDGFSNWDEFLAGTDAHNPSSLLKTSAFDFHGGPTAGFTISWQSVVGKTYVICRSTNLLCGFTQIGSRVATSNREEYVDTDVFCNGLRFYRVGVE